jgi:glycosyltransferase involved in cell wall biosynthesis
MHAEGAPRERRGTSRAPLDASRSTTPRSAGRFEPPWQALAKAGTARRIGFAPVILLLHNRYRVPGGEERAVEDLAWLIRTELGEDAEVLARDSAAIGRGRAAAGLLRGGLDPGDVAAAVRRTGARVVHAHNVQPSLGWRALAAARDAGARVVLHLHNYRLVCAVGTCFTQGGDCTRCHGRNTLPGVRLNCRGGSRAESLAYGAGLALWQRRIARNADAFVVPSTFALRRLEGLGAPLGGRAHVIPSVQRDIAERSRAAGGSYALYAGRLTEEKGVADAIAACRAAGVPLVIAGDGPQASALRALADDPASSAAPGDAAAMAPSVRFTGRVDAAELARLRAGAALALVPSRYAEILPLAALEAMAAGLPVVASRAGGLAEIVPAPGLHPPGDVAAMAERIGALYGDAAAGEVVLAVARERTAPAVIGAALRAVYDGS